ncbi:hypothetical protein SLAVM298S_04712 [Streptomyces lavendulae subsp. lavendulae]
MSSAVGAGAAAGAAAGRGCGGAGAAAGGGGGLVEEHGGGLGAALHGPDGGQQVGGLAAELGAGVHGALAFRLAAGDAFPFDLLRGQFGLGLAEPGRCRFRALRALARLPGLRALARLPGLRGPVGRAGLLPVLGPCLGTTGGARVRLGVVGRGFVPLAVGVGPGRVLFLRRVGRGRRVGLRGQCGGRARFLRGGGVGGAGGLGVRTHSVLQS